MASYTYPLTAFPAGELVHPTELAVDVRDREIQIVDFNRAIVTLVDATFVYGVDLPPAQIIALDLLVAEYVGPVAPAPSPQRIASVRPTPLFYGSLEQNGVPFGSSNSSYTRLFPALFPGTSLWVVPASIDLLVSSAHSTAGAAFRVVDVTNGSKVIAEVSPVVSGPFSIVTLTNLANLPTDKAYLEVQGKRLVSPARAEFLGMAINP